MQSAKKRLNRVNAYGASILLALGILAFVTRSGLVLAPAVAAGLTYSIWRMNFSCPRCGTPFLYDMRGPFMVPRLLGDRCRRCGLATDADYSGPFDPTSSAESPSD